MCKYAQNNTNMNWDDLRLFLAVARNGSISGAAIKEELGASILPCFMGDSDPALERYSEPDPTYNLGLWILLHPDLKRTARVLTFRDHMINAINQKRDLFEGNCQQPCKK